MDGTKRPSIPCNCMTVSHMSNVRPQLGCSCSFPRFSFHTTWATCNTIATQHPLASKAANDVSVDQSNTPRLSRGARKRGLYFSSPAANTPTFAARSPLSYSCNKRYMCSVAIGRIMGILASVIRSPCLQQKQFRGLTAGSDFPGLLFAVLQSATHLPTATTTTACDCC